MATANECIPYKQPGEAITAKASATIGGKRFVKISANRTGGPTLSTDLANTYQVAQCVNGDKSLGVSGWDAASGSLLKVITAPGVIVPVVCGATITAGQEVQSDANGAAIPLAAGKANGIAMTGAAAAADAEIKLY
jgi:hypothetical protein